MTSEDAADEQEWLTAALAEVPRHVFVAVGSDTLHCNVWEPTADGPIRANLVLLHGNAAQKEWWDATGPLLPDDMFVVALDVSGHGDSPHREAYTLDRWADEVSAVIDECCGDAPTILVGHSMGGLIALWTAWRDPERFAGIITMDTPLRRYTSEQLAKRIGISKRPLRRHSTLAAAVAEFKTVPEVIDAPQPLIRHVAARSQREVGGEWVLKFDPVLYGRTTDVDAFLRPFPPRTFCVRAEHGLIDERMALEIAPLLDGPDRMMTVPGVGHNLILEAPLASTWLITALSAQILRELGHSVR